MKRNGFQLLNLPEAGLRDVLVVKIKEDKQVIHHVKANLTHDIEKLTICCTLNLTTAN